MLTPHKPTCGVHPKKVCGDVLEKDGELHRCMGFFEFEIPDELAAAEEAVLPFLIEQVCKEAKWTGETLPSAYGRGGLAWVKTMKRLQIADLTHKKDADAVHRFCKRVASCENPFTARKLLHGSYNYGTPRVEALQVIKERLVSQGFM